MIPNPPAPIIPLDTLGNKVKVVCDPTLAPSKLEQADLFE